MNNKYKKIAMSLLAVIFTIISVVADDIDAKFEDIIEIEFKHHIGKKEKISIKDKEQIAKILKTIVLEKKLPCACEHTWIVLFKKEKSQIYVHFCDHCFDIQDKGKNYLYKMPKAFYKKFKKLLKEYKEKSNKSVSP